MDIDLIRGLSTVLAMIAFIAVACWAWGRKRQPEFDAAARLPLLEDEQQKGH